jgi:hypothetical protein
MDVVSVADGTGDLTSMPRRILDRAAEWLGDPPQYRLALTIGDSPACRELAWRIANEFARSWPAVWSNHSTEPVAPLGTWWTRRSGARAFLPLAGLAGPGQGGFGPLVRDLLLCRRRSSTAAALVVDHAG